MSNDIDIIDVVDGIWNPYIAFGEIIDGSHSIILMADESKFKLRLSAPGVQIILTSDCNKGLTSSSSLPHSPVGFTFPPLSHTGYYHVILHYHYDIIQSYLTHN